MCGATPRERTSTFVYLFVIHVHAPSQSLLVTAVLQAFVLPSSGPVPSHVQVVPSPPHTPQASSWTDPPGAPLQSICQDRADQGLADQESGVYAP